MSKNIKTSPIQNQTILHKPPTTASNNQTDGVDFHDFENIEYPYCPDVSKYEKVIKIGQGTFG